MALWVIRILFVCLCSIGGYAVSQVRPEFIGGSYSGPLGMIIGFGFGWLMIALDEMLKSRRRGRGFRVRKYLKVAIVAWLRSSASAAMLKSIVPFPTGWPTLWSAVAPAVMIVPRLGAPSRAS